VLERIRCADPGAPCAVCKAARHGPHLAHADIVQLRCEADARLDLVRRITAARTSAA
jgi:hypothetical protein